MGTCGAPPMQARVTPGSGDPATARPVLTPLDTLLDAPGVAAEVPQDGRPADAVAQTVPYDPLMPEAGTCDLPTQPSW